MKTPDHIARLADKYIAKDGGEGTEQLTAKPPEFSGYDLSHDPYYLEQIIRCIVEKTMMRCFERYMHGRDRYAPSYTRPSHDTAEYYLMTKDKF